MNSDQNRRANLIDSAYRLIVSGTPIPPKLHRWLKDELEPLTEPERLLLRGAAERRDAEEAQRKEDMRRMNEMLRPIREGLK